MGIVSIIFAKKTGNCYEIDMYILDPVNLLGAYPIWTIVPAHEGVFKHIMCNNNKIWNQWLFIKEIVEQTMIYSYPI